MQTTQHPRRWRAAFGVAAAGLLLGGGATLTADAQTPGASEPLEFVALAPTRILDTRNGIGAASAAKVGAGQTIQLEVAGRTLNNGVVVPANARAVMVNATSTEANAPTFITFFPSGQARPNSSTLNAVFGANSSGLGSENVPNMVTVTLGSDGDVSIFNLAGSTHVLADIAGYYIPAGSGGGAGGSPITGGPNNPTGPCTSGAVFLNTTTGQLFSCVNGAWVPGANITGPAGPQGPAGPAGQTGPNGVVNAQISPPLLTLPILTVPAVPVTVLTFTPQPNTNYLLDATIDAEVASGLLTLGAEVECFWSNAATRTFGESLVAAALQLIPARGNLGVPGTVAASAAPAPVLLRCVANQLVGLGTTVTLNGTVIATQVTTLS